MDFPRFSDSTTGYAIRYLFSFLGCLTSFDVQQGLWSTTGTSIIDSPISHSSGGLVHISIFIYPCRLVVFHLAVARRPWNHLPLNSVLLNSADDTPLVLLLTRPRNFSTSPIL